MSSTITQNLSQLVLQMSESATIKMAQMARDLAAQGHDVISLSLGEPDFDTPQHIKDAAVKALADGYTKYTPVPGLVELRKAIITKFKRDNNLDFDMNRDEVIILAPYWVSYSAIVKMVGATPVPVSGGIEKDFKVTGDQLKEAITENTKMVLFSSPCNPTGSVYTHDELQDIANVVEQHENITIVSDEIYEYINFTDKHVSIGTFENVKDRTVTVNGFAKGFAMTGWRLGYIGAPAWIAKACAKIQGQFTSGANAFGQMAGAHALTSDLTPTHKMKEAFQKRRDLVKSLLDEIPGVKTNNPQGAFYFFPDISSFFGKSDGEITVNNSVEFCEYLLQNAHVAAVAGSAFGDENCFRISYAASEEQLTEAMKRIKTACAKLK